MDLSSISVRKVIIKLDAWNVLLRASFSDFGCKEWMPRRKE